MSPADAIPAGSNAADATPAGILQALRQHGATLTVEAGALRIRAPAGSVPAELIEAARPVKPALLSLVTQEHETAERGADAGWTERAAIAEQDGGVPRPVAEALADADHPPAPEPEPENWSAWHAAEVAKRAPGMGQEAAERRVFGLALTIWHRHHGRRPAAGRCAGCGQPLGPDAGHTLPDGATVHGDGRFVACLASYGERWRPAAAAALAELGIRAPADPAGGGALC